MTKKTIEVDRASIWLIVLVAVGLVSSQVVLVRQNVNLKAEVEQASVRANRQLEAAAGTALPALNGSDLAGAPLSINYGVDQRKTLVYVFSAVCPWCERNKPNWVAIASAIDRSKFRVVGVDLSSTVTEDFLQKENLQLDLLFSRVDPKLIRDYKLTLTPQTLLIDSEGRVERVWTGLYNKAEGAELTKKLNLSVELPALGSS